MRYRVIEGGYWRHSTLHIESDSLIKSYSYEDGAGKTEYVHNSLREFISDATGLELYRDITDWLIKGNEYGAYRSTFSARACWPEYFGVYPHMDGIIDIMVNEEGTMWFIPEYHSNYDTPAPEEGVRESWLHGTLAEDNTIDCIWFEVLFPDGYTIESYTIPAK